MKREGLIHKAVFPHPSCGFTLWLLTTENICPQVLCENLVFSAIGTMLIFLNSAIRAFMKNVQISHCVELGHWRKRQHSQHWACESLHTVKKKSEFFHLTIPGVTSLL